MPEKGLNYPREIRLGIVFYGGVSLAIYENGVAQELFHAVKGEGVYGLLKDLIGSDIVVDIISGTSAGGINGIFLGYALANNRDFTAMSTLWREKADIARLLRGPKDPEVNSLLDGSGYFQPELEAAFRVLNEYTPSQNARPSTCDELDLFVTGTDVHGDVHTVYDDLGRAIDVKNHRGVFKLSFRRGRKNSFDPSSVPQLATLARITSCFPVAFEPVPVDIEQHRDLSTWGRLESSKVFLDGGILDNKPFSYTLDAIYRRTALRPVDRFLYYVEPDPEHFDRSRVNMEIPNIGSAALDALINIPGYESIGDDLAEIRRRNSQVNTINTLAEYVEATAVPSEVRLEDVSVVPPENSSLYLRARLMQLRDRAVEGILNDGGRRAHFAEAEVRRSGKILVESFLYWQAYGGDPREALRLFDIYYRLRRMFHVTYALHTATSVINDDAARAEYTGLWEAANHHLQSLEILQTALERYIDHIAVEWKSLSQSYPRPELGKDELTPEQYTQISADRWGQVERGLRALLDPAAVPYPEPGGPAVLTDFHRRLKARMQALGNEPPLATAPTPDGNLLLEADAAMQKLIAAWAEQRGIGEPVVRAWSAFLLIDTQIFPLQFASNIQTRDVLNIVRLSPIDAKRGFSGRPVEDKICGRTLGAFGGFFKRSWRSNDIMWGRLDAACQIVECLLTPERVRQAAWQPGLAAITRRVHRLFPKTPAADRMLLAKSMANLRALDRESFDRFVTGLVAAAQTEIYNAEWPRVVEDSLLQEREWSQHVVDRAAADKEGVPYDVPRLVWSDASTRPDALLVRAAASAITSGKLPAFPDCRIAGTTIGEAVPRPVLLELASRVLMRLDKSLTPVLPVFARLPVLHKAVFGWTLPAVHGWSSYHRTAPEWRVASVAALLAASVTILVVTAVVMPYEPRMPSATLIALVVSALLVIGGTHVLFRRHASTSRRVLTATAVGLFVITLLTAALAAVMPAVQSGAGSVRTFFSGLAGR